MPDISMCANNKCRKKYSCYRYCAKPSEWQSYMEFKRSDYSCFMMMSCCICGYHSAEAHHIRTRGAGGKDNADNYLILCRKHHTEIHTIGRDTFGKKYNLTTIIEKAKQLKNNL